MNVIFKATDDLMVRVRKDLLRGHAFAYERVGFITAGATWASSNLVLLARDYYPVDDADYLDDPSVGAMIGQEAFRKILEIALMHKVGVFHVHEHLFEGRLWFSSTDLREQAKFVPDFFKVRREMPHGALVLNGDAAAGRVWMQPNRIEHVTEFDIIGAGIRFTRTDSEGGVDMFA